MALSGPKVEQLRDALCSAFDIDSLEQMVRFKLGKHLFDFVQRRALRNVAFDLIDDAEQEGFTAALIAAMYETRPQNPAVLEFCRNHAPEVLDPQHGREVHRDYVLGFARNAQRRPVEEKQLTAMERFGVALNVDLQTKGQSQPTASPAAPLTDHGLERLVRPHLPLLDAGLWRQQMMKMEGRVCRVEVGGRPIGSGFLVGPDTLMTNYHVLRDVIKNPALAPTVKFRFDYEVLANGTKSEGILVLLCSKPNEWLIDYSSYTNAEAENTPDAATPTDDELDYALVRLERTVGNEPLNGAMTNNVVRGWIKVPASAPALGAGMPILILQHPKAEPLKLAMDMQGVISILANGTRVRYATNTESGSSGSPCFDIDWNLVALHHYGDPGFDHPAHYNQGVPVIKIRERLGRLGKAGSLGGDPP